MSDPVLGAAIAAVSAVAAAMITAWLARRQARDNNRIAEIDANLAVMNELNGCLEKRVEALERELATVKDALLKEQEQHAATRELLRIAMRHIRDMLSWLGSDRAGEPPEVPDELTHQL